MSVLSFIVCFGVSLWRNVRSVAQKSTTIPTAHLTVLMQGFVNVRYSLGMEMIKTYPTPATQKEFDHNMVVLHEEYYLKASKECDYKKMKEEVESLLHYLTVLVEVHVV